jgi:hypothetical protein
VYNGARICRCGSIGSYFLVVKTPILTRRVISAGAWIGRKSMHERSRAQLGHW